MPKYDASGYMVFDHDESDLVKAKHNGYCARCYHTFFKNEKVVKHKDRHGVGFVHRDCMVALADYRPRKLNPGVEGIIGAVDKGIMKKKAKKMILANQT